MFYYERRRGCSILKYYRYTTVNIIIIIFVVPTDGFGAVGPVIASTRSGWNESTRPRRSFIINNNNIKIDGLLFNSARTATAVVIKRDCCFIHHVCEYCFDYQFLYTYNNIIYSVLHYLYYSYLTTRHTFDGHIYRLYDI